LLPAAGAARCHRLDAIAGIVVTRAAPAGSAEGEDGAVISHCVAGGRAGVADAVQVATADADQPVGSSDSGMKMLQMKVSSKAMASTMGWAASTLGMKMAGAKPRQQKAVAPTVTSRTTAAGPGRQGRTCRDQGGAEAGERILSQGGAGCAEC
jgi:hypothetical protein